MAQQKSFRKQIERTFGQMEKRIRLVAAALIMTALMVVSTFFFFDLFWLFIPVLSVAAYICTYLAVLEDIDNIEWSMLFLMPVLFTVSFYVFYFLFPVRWITRVPFMFMYGCSLYAILLTSNIFNIGVGKSLQLYRAAFSVNYFYQTIITFLLFNVLFSFKQNFLINALVCFLITLPLCFQLLWTVRLKTYIEPQVRNYSVFISLVIAELVLLISFIPVKSTIFALFLTACYYTLTGLIYNYIDNKLFKQTIREYVFVAGFVTLIVLLSIQW